MEPASPEQIQALWRAARRLRRRSRWAKAELPPLWFFTDPQRTPEPERVAERLPAGSGLVFRAFGAPDAEARGRRLAAIARARGLVLLVGADASLAEAVAADGVHLPQRLARQGPRLKARRADWIVTQAAHDARSLARAEQHGVDAAFLSTVAPSRSPSAEPNWPPWRVRRMVAGASLPVFGLGGVTTETAASLRPAGLAGLAAVDAFLAR